MILLVNSNSIRIPLADESVHCVVTSPPYWGLRDYDLPPLIWGGEAGCRHVWGDETRRGMTGGGVESSTLGVLSGGHGMSKEAHEKSIERSRYDASQGQFCQLCNAWRGCLGLEPTPEEYVVNMVQVFREVWRVLRRDGTVWLNLGSSYAGSWGNYAPGGIKGQQRPRTEQGERWERKAYGDTSFLPPTATVTSFKPKDLIPIPWMVAMALQADGWWLRSDIIWHKPNCMPESVQDRPTTSHEYLFLLAKSKRYFYDAQAIVVPGAGRENFGQGQVKCHINKDRNDAGRLDMTIKGYRNRRTVWTIPTKPYKGAHFATFPPALVEPCIKAGTSERGVCPECGAQWERVVDKPKPPSEVFTKRNAPTDELICSGSRIDGKMVGHGQKLQDWLNANPPTTTGWQPTCACDTDHAIPATVLDPFVGSGTTCLVARSLSRRSIGLDLSFAYLRDQARARLELDRLEAWENGKQVEANWEELPLFQTS